jgi:hypothetical protein
MAEVKGVPNYPGNSKAETRQAALPEVPVPNERKVEKVIEGEVIQRKKPLGRRIADTFTGDTMHDVGDYILFEVIIPAAKDLFFEAIKEGLQRRLWGDSRPSRSTSNNRSTTLRTNYNKMSAVVKNDMSYKARATHNFDEIVLASLGEAEEVIDNMSTLIRDFDVVSVSDVLTMVGVTPAFTDVKWGWDDIRGARVKRLSSDQYLLDLPRPIPLD